MQDRQTGMLYLGRDIEALERKEVTSGGKDTVIDSEELCPMI